MGWFAMVIANTIMSNKEQTATGVEMYQSKEGSTWHKQVHTHRLIVSWSYFLLLSSPEIIYARNAYGQINRPGMTTVGSMLQQSHGLSISSCHLSTFDRFEHAASPGLHSLIYKFRSWKACGSISIPNTPKNKPVWEQPNRRIWLRHRRPVT